MSDTDSQTYDDPRHASIVKLIQEKLGVHLTNAEHIEKENLDTLKTLKAEVDTLVKQGSDWITELDQAIAKKEEALADQKVKAPGINIDLDEDAPNGKPAKKPPSSTRETKTGHFTKNDGKDRRPSDVGAASKSLNDVSEEHKANANKRPVTAKDTKKGDKSVDKKPVPPKTVKNPKEEKKTDAKEDEDAEGGKPKKDDKKAPVQKATGKGKEEKKTGGKAEDAKEEEAAHPANPELEAIVNEIDANSLTNIKSSKNPNAAILKTLQAIVQLTFGKNEKWEEIKNRLTDQRKFLKALPCLDVEKIPKKNLEAAQKLVTDGDLTEASTTKASPAAGTLYKYLIAAIKLVEPTYNSPEEVEKLEEETNPERPELKEILDQITDAQLAELKASKKEPVAKVFQAALELTQGKSVVWKEISQTYLASQKALHKVLRVPFETLPKTNVESASKIVNDSKLTEESLKKVHVAAAEIYKWLVAALKIADPSYNSPEEVVKQQEEAERLEEEKNPENPELKAILDEIQEAWLVETRALRTPLDSAIKTLQAISQLTHGKELPWKEIVTTYLQSVKGLRKTLKLDFGNIPKENLEVSKKKITDSKLSENNAKKASVLIATLYKWLIAAIKLAEPEFKSPEEIAAEKAESGEAEQQPEETKTSTKKAGDKGKDTKKDTKKDDADKKAPAPTPAKNTTKTQPSKEDKKAAGKVENPTEEGKTDKKAPAKNTTKTQPPKEDKKPAGKAGNKAEGENADAAGKGKGKGKGDDKKDAAPTPAKNTAKTQPPKEEKKTGGKTATKAEANPENPEIKAALDTIEKHVLTEMKSLPNPPAGVLQITQVLSLLTQGKPSEWKLLVKSHLADLPTLHKAMNVNYTKVGKKNVEAARKLIDDNNLTEELLRTKSYAASLLFRVAQVALKLADPSHSQSNGDSEKPNAQQAEEQGQASEEKVEEVKAEESQASQENHEAKPEEHTDNQTEQKTQEQTNHQPETKVEEHHEQKKAEEQHEQKTEQHHEQPAEHKPEVHLNGDQAVPNHEEKRQEAPAAVEEGKSEANHTEATTAESTNHQNLNHDLSE